MSLTNTAKTSNFIFLNIWFPNCPRTLYLRIHSFPLDCVGYPNLSLIKFLYTCATFSISIIFLSSVFPLLDQYQTALITKIYVFISRGQLPSMSPSFLPSFFFPWRSLKRIVVLTCHYDCLGGPRVSLKKPLRKSVRRRVKVFNTEEVVMGTRGNE